MAHLRVPVKEDAAIPDPCKYDSQSEFVSACVSERQDENPSEDNDQSVAICFSMWRDRDCNKAADEPNIVYKAGQQSDDDPYEFVMSTNAVDRMGDIVEQDWDLRDFKKNPIALWAHRHDQPIGVWERVRKDGERLIGRLRLAERGTSTFIDTLRSLIEQRILKAVSVGFLSKNSEPLDEKDPWGGYRLAGNVLMECSLVSVPANQEALSVARAMSKSLAQGLGENDGVDLISTRVPAHVQLGVVRSQDSDDSLPPKTKFTERKTAMSLSERITAKQEELTNAKNQLTELTEKAFDPESDLDETGRQETETQIDELNTNIERYEHELGVMERSQKSLQVRAVATQPSAQDQTRAPSSGVGAGAGAAPRIEVRVNRPKGHKAIACVTSLLLAHISKRSAIDVVRAGYKDEPEIETVVRAATDPATMTDAAWAAPLVRETWGEFLELIRDISVYPRLPGLRLDFDRYGKINIPKNNGRGNLAGSFVAEGAPIPVREGVYATTDMEPFKLAVITTFTREIATHSIPAIQSLVQTQILADTAETLDALYLDANARSGRPAGLQDATETGAANINAATPGNTVATIIADAEAMVGRLLAARTGDQAVWLLNPLHVLTLRNLQDAASGEFVFRAEIAAGTFMGYPFISSQNIAVNLLILQSNGAVAYASDYAPQIEVSDQATIVFDDTAPDHVLPDTNTQPAKSMYQMDGVAVKMRTGLDWRIMRQGGVQVLTGFLA